MTGPGWDRLFKIVHDVESYLASSRARAQWWYTHPHVEIERPIITTGARRCPND
ncbi:MAG: hypothetical protein JWP01_2808 [Myxococcales bacterium]|nr:hypothetical protein [Myxococcales bacterium]